LLRFDSKYYYFGPGDSIAIVTCNREVPFICGAFNYCLVRICNDDVAAISAVGYESANQALRHIAATDKRYLHALLLR